MKKWYLSKGVWLGAIEIITAGLMAYEAGVSPVAIALAVFGAATIVVRAITDTPLIK